MKDDATKGLNGGTRTRRHTVRPNANVVSRATENIRGRGGNRIEHAIVPSFPKLPENRSRAKLPGRIPSARRRRDVPYRKSRRDVAAQPPPGVRSRGALEEEVPAGLNRTARSAKGGRGAPFVVQVAARAKAVGISKQAEDLDLGRGHGAPIGDGGVVKGGHRSGGGVALITHKCS